MLPLSDEVRALGARLAGDDLIVFPVRHHSPACAWQLDQLLRDVKPSAILVEGPRGFTDTIPFLVHDAARMPLAIYTYTVERAAADLPPRRRAAYYPFCDYSPELVALRAARRHDVPARFIDLDFAEQCALEASADDAADPDRPGDGAASLLDERRYERSRYLHALAEQLGCRDHEELWEHLFEAPMAGRSLREHVTAVAAYCHLARLESTDAELQADGTLAREAEMAWHIHEALAQRQPGDGPVVAVIGGFHAVVMPALLAAPPARPRVQRGALADEASALIRYGFDRLDRLNGYAAGMTSPAWHQRVWEQTGRFAKLADVADAGRRGRQEVAMTMLFDIAVELRERHAVALPMPALTAAFEQALRLATLRRREAPVRDDVLDAVRSCFVKGEADAEGALILAVSRRLLCGTAMGSVPAGASTPPLVKDFDYRARRQRLKIDDSEPHRAALDLYRRAEHRLTSRLFHGLALLAIPMARRTAGPDFVAGTGLDRLQEHWDYTFSPATAAALVEASVYGVTVPLAVAARFDLYVAAFEAESGGRDAGRAAALLTQGCVLGLHDHLPRVLAMLARCIASDAAFESVAAAAGTLGLLWESREPLEARALEELPVLLKAAFERAIFLGHGMRGLVGDGVATLDALKRLRELLASTAGAALDGALYWALVRDLGAHHDAALVRGAAIGLAYASGRLDENQLGAAVAGHLDGLLAPHESVAFLRGLLGTAREAAWQQPALLAVIDRLLATWGEDQFVALLPEMRLAFAELTPKETDRVAQAVASLHGDADLGTLVHAGISAGEVQAHLALGRRLHDVLAADGLADWGAR